MTRADRLTTDDAMRILVSRYPELPAQAGADAPYAFAALAGPAWPPTSPASTPKVSPPHQ